MKKITFLFITVFLIIASTVIIVAQPQFESTTIKELSRIKRVNELVRYLQSRGAVDLNPRLDPSLHISKKSIFPFN
jgi:hypothetical protein